MKQIILGGLGVLALASTSVFASLIPLGAIPSTGNGLGAVNSVVTFQNTGTEYGCVGFAGGATATGAAQCFGGVNPPGGITHEQTGSGNNTYLASTLGITSGGGITFANVALIFNGNEGGNPADQAITLNNLSLNLFSSSGTFLAAFSTVNSFSALAFPGTGNAGFGFRLDAAQAIVANAFLAANPNLVIGASVAVSGANAGPDTVFIATGSGIPTITPFGADPIPEPTSMILMGFGLLGLSLFRQKQLRSK
jgi:hypothetical protein